VIAQDGLRPSDLLVAFFVLGLAFLLAAIAAGLLYAVGGWAEGRWLCLHLAFVGGVSQLVLGASQFFVGAFLATTPPSRALVRAQLAAWNLGTVLVAVGVTARYQPATSAGAVVLVTGLVLFVAGLRAMQRRSLQRAPWAARWYFACAGSLALGVVAGALLGGGVSWRWGSLLGAHLVLNLGGWFGTAIVGTLHTFYPSLTQTRLRFARLQPPAFAAWVLGIAALAAGYAFGSDWLAVTGWSGLILAAVLLAANLLASALRAPVPLPLTARLIGAGHCFLFAALVLGWVVTISSGAVAPTGEERVALAILLLAGWLALTVLGSLLHLLAVVARVRDLRRPFPARHRVLDVAVPVVVVAAVALLAATQLFGNETLLGAAAVPLALAYLFLLARALVLAVHALRHGGMGV
jgi:nitrite reductase (NO-forming)